MTSHAYCDVGIDNRDGVGRAVATAWMHFSTQDVNDGAFQTEVKFGPFWPVYEVYVALTIDKDIRQGKFNP